MPATTSLGIPYPLQGDSLLVHQHMQSLAAAVDTLLALPDEQAASATTNSITSAAGTYAALGNPVSVSMTNPHASRSLLCHVNWGGWLAPDAVSGRLGILGSGGNTFSAPTSSTNGPQNFSEQLVIVGPQNGSGSFISVFADFTMRIPPSATTTLDLVGYRSAITNAVSANYCKIRITPLRYV